MNETSEGGADPANQAPQGGREPLPAPAPPGIGAFGNAASLSTPAAPLSPPLPPPVSSNPPTPLPPPPIPFGSPAATRSYPGAPVYPPAGGTPPPGPGPGPRRTPPDGGGNGRRRSGWFWAFLLVAGLGTCALLLLAVGMSRFGRGSFAGLGTSSKSHGGLLHETVLESAPTRDKIAVVDVQGVISSEAWDYTGNNLVNYIEEQLDRAADDDHVKAVVLKIDSPGGEVLASDEIYKLVMDFQEEHEKPVIASMGTVAASGGYYVASPCRWIVANELTITGSIGVIMQSYNWRGLMDKIGVRPQVFKSGQLKDMLSPDKREEDITNEERRIVQDLVNETFERFKSIVEEGRGLAKSRNEENQGEEVDHGRPLAGNWKDYADGRLLSGKEAWRLGLIDELGDFAAAVERAKKLAGIDDARLVQYLRPMPFGSLFRLFGKSEETKVKIDLGIPTPQLRSGLYFLAPHLVR